MNAIELANKMIDVYNTTPVEKYPEARALDVLENVPFNSRERIQAFNLFQSWLTIKESEPQND